MNEMEPVLLFFERPPQVALAWYWVLGVAIEELAVQCAS